jgi:hypothetical protein
MLVISADVSLVIDNEIMYLRLQTDDMPRSGTRHTLTSPSPVHRLSLLA